MKETINRLEEYLNYNDVDGTMRAMVYSLIDHADELLNEFEELEKENDDMKVRLKHAEETITEIQEIAEDADESESNEKILLKIDEFLF